MGKVKNLSEFIGSDRDKVKKAKESVAYVGEKQKIGYWSTPQKVVQKCFLGHKALVLVNGLEIYGGSCISPSVVDADVYIGFDQGMAQGAQGFPWTPGFEVYYPVTDMSTPKNVENFSALVDWTIAQLESGSKVHAGCIGGHGRTGMFFSALYSRMSGSEDATSYVREHYCEKAVESQKQVDWLQENYGVKPVKPVKVFSSSSVIGKKGRLEFTNPVKSAMSIWGGG